MARIREARYSDETAVVVMRDLGKHMARRLVLRSRCRVGRVTAGEGYTPTRTYTWSDWQPCTVRVQSTDRAQDGSDAPAGTVTILLEPGTTVAGGDRVEVLRADTTDMYEVEGPVERGPVLHVQCRRVP